MLVWLFIVHLLHPVPLLQTFDIRCPDSSQWQFKEKGFCNKSVPDYYCLLDENKKTPTEFCRNGSEFNRPGYTFVVSGALNTKVCSGDLYQPFKFRTNYSSDCVLKMSNCSEEGQIKYNNGNPTSDRACRCDHTQGFGFVHKPDNECFCHPAYEDCSCYFMSCGHDTVLTPDYQCVETSNWTGNFKCPKLGTELTRKTQQVQSKLSIVIQQSFWCQHLDAKDTYNKPSQKEDIHMFVWAIYTTIVVMCLIILGYLILLTKCFDIHEAVIENRNKRNFRDTKKKRIRANFYDIITTIDNEVVTKYLISKNILNDNYLRDLSGRRKVKNQELLKTLWKSDQYWIDHFMDALQNNGYSELANQINGTRIDDFDEPDKDLSDDEDGNKNIPQYNRELNTRYTKDWVFEDQHFITTSASSKIEEMIKQKNCVLLVGGPGEGKTTLIRHIAVKLYQEEDYDIVPIVMVPLIIRNFYNADRKQVFVVDDFCGSDRINETSVDLWVLPHYTTLFRNIIDPNIRLDKKNIPKKDIKILIACNSEVYNESLFNSLGFYTQFSILLSNWPLTPTERKAIIQNLPDNNERSDSNRLIKGFTFSLLCKLSDRIVSDPNQIETFFEKPFEFIERDIKKIKKQQDLKFFIISLLALFDNKLNDDWLNITLLQERDRNSIECISSHFQINFQDESSIEKIKETIEILKQTYILKSGRTYTFIHETIYDIVAAVCGKRFFPDFVNLASSRFIAERYILEAIQNESDQTKTLILITPDNETMFFGRLIRDLENGDTCSFLHNRQLKHIRYRANFLKHCKTESSNIKNILAKLKKKKQISNTSQKDKNEHLIEKVDHEDDFYIKLQQMGTNYTTSIGIPLIESVIEGYDDIVNFLLEMGCDIDETHTYGRSSLYIAAILNHIDIVKLLIKNKANISMCNHKGRTVLYVSCRYGHYEIVNELLQTKQDISQCDDEESTPLHAASLEGHACVVQLLLDKNHSVDPVDSQDRTPLLLASERGHTAVVNSLIDAGSDISLKSKTGWSALFAACKNDKKDVVELLIKARASLSEYDSYGRSPLLIAAINGSDEVLKLLLLKKADITICDNHDCSALYLACKGGHETTVNILLQNNCPVNTCNKKGKSPLHVACGKGNVEIVQSLLGKGAFVEAVDRCNRTALHVSCKTGNIKTTKLLLVNKNIINIYDNDGNSPLHIACKRGIYEIVNILILSGADVYHSNKENKPPLHIACSKGDYAIADLLLKKQVQIDNRDHEVANPLLSVCEKGTPEITRLLLEYVDNEKRTPLHIASINGREDIVQSLLDKKHKVDPFDSHHRTPLFLAAERGHTEVVNVLIQEGSHISLEDKTGMSPFFVACKNDEKAVVELLIKARASLSKCDGDGRTPLLIAAINGSDEVLKLLLLEKADITICDNRDRSALYLACKGGHETTVTILLQNNCPVNTCDKKGKSPLYVACGKGNVEIVQSLLSKGAIVEAVDRCKRTALHVSCKKGNLKTIKRLLDNEKIIYIYDNDGNSPLHIACERGIYEIVNILILNGAEVHHRKKGGRQPLHIACSKGHQAIVDLLLKKRVQIDTCDDEGATPLFIACKIGQAKIASILLQHKASVSVCDNEKRSPLHIACIRGHDDIVRALLEERPYNSIEKDNEGKTALDWAKEKNYRTITNLLTGKQNL